MVKAINYPIYFKLGKWSVLTTDKEIYSFYDGKKTNNISRGSNYKESMKKLWETQKLSKNKSLSQTKIKKNTNKFTEKYERAIKTSSKGDFDNNKELEKEVMGKIQVNKGIAIDDFSKDETDSKKTIEKTGETKNENHIATEPGQYISIEEIKKYGNFFALKTPEKVIKQGYNYDQYKLDPEKFLKKYPFWKKIKKTPKLAESLKAPEITRTKNPTNYMGVDDEKWGSGLNCERIEELKSYFTVIDLDYGGEIPLEKIEKAFSFIMNETHVRKTPSGGYHIYLLSKEKPSLPQPSKKVIKIDYQKTGRYVVFDYRYEVFAVNEEGILEQIDLIKLVKKNFHELTGSDINESVKKFFKSYGLKMGRADYVPTNDKGILIVESSDEILEKGLNNLGIKATKQLAMDSDIHNIDFEGDDYTFDGKILVESLRPFFTRGHYHNLGLYLTGFLYRNLYSEEFTKNILNSFNKDGEGDIAIQNILNSIYRHKKGVSVPGWKALSEYINDDYDFIENDKKDYLLGILFKRFKKEKPKDLTKSQIATITFILEDYLNHQDLQKEDKELLFIALKKSLKKLRFSDFSINDLLETINEKEDFKKLMKKYDEKKRNVDLSCFHKILPKLKGVREKRVKEDMNNIMIIINPDIVFNKLEKSNSFTNQIQASKLLENEYNIKRTVDDFYYYDEKNDKYAELDHRILGILIKNEYGTYLQDIQSKAILSGIQRKDSANPYFWGFKNGLLDIRDGTFHKNKKRIFTTRYLGLIDEITKEFTPFTYDPDVNTQVNWNYEEITLTQKTLQEILIPKNDKNDEKIYYDHLQRGGSNLQPINRTKKSTTYFNTVGNNGKEIIKITKEKILNEYLANIKTDEYLNDTFGDSTTQANKNAIILDEVKKNSFIGHEDDFKRKTSGGKGVDTRKLHSSEVYSAETSPMVYILSNLIYRIDLDDTAFLYRNDFLLLPNTFVDKKEEDLGENEYKEDGELYDKIRNDFEGLEWLINAQIKEFLAMPNKNKFLATQTAYETLMIINDDDPIQNWFNLHIEPTNEPEDIITNEEIRLELEHFIKEKKIKYDTETQKYGIDVGNWLKENFEHKMNVEWEKVKKRKAGGVSYKGFKIKTDTQIRKDYNISYEIDEDTGLANNDNMYRLNKEEKLIFNKIKKNPYIHHRILRKEYSKIRIEEVLDSLWEKGFIKKIEN